MDKVRTAESRLVAHPPAYSDAITDLRAVQIAVIHDNFKHATARVLQCKRVLNDVQYRDANIDLDNFLLRLEDAEKRSK